MLGEGHARERGLCCGKTYQGEGTMLGEGPARERGLLTWRDFMTGFLYFSVRLTTAFSKLLTCILPNLRQKNCYPGSAGIKSASFTVILVHCFCFLFSSWRTPFPLPVILESRLFSHCHPGARWKRTKDLRVGGRSYGARSIPPHPEMLRPARCRPPA